MKSFIPWFCFATATGVVWADGVDSYRLGQYQDAAVEFSNVPNDTPIAQYYQGKMRLYGYGELRDQDKALQHFSKAAEKGLLPAIQFMASFNLMIQDNPVEALNWYKKAAMQGDTQAQMFCAAAYLFGYGSKPSPDIAKRYYIDAAKSGNPIAQYTLAIDFLSTRHAENKKLGLIWLNKSAKAQYIPAISKLGELTFWGNGVIKDEVKGRAMIEEAAQKNDPLALFNLGNIALSQKDWAKAKSYYEQSSGLAYSPADLALASIYFTKESPFYHEQDGFLVILQSAQAGRVASQKKLVQLYHEGKGVTQDESLSKEWAKVASQTEKQKGNAKLETIRYLTYGKEQTFNHTPYAMKGILSPWKNKAALLENRYNPAPLRESLTRETIFKPNFHLVDPKSIAISEYYDLIAQLSPKKEGKMEVFNHYPIADPVIAIKQGHLDSEAQDILRQAVLGDTESQFMAGQMYQHGIGVQADKQMAAKFYNMAAVLQDERAQYELAIMALTEELGTPDFQKGLALLSDAAFKGDVYAQYALGRIYESGYGALDHKTAIPASPEQAVAMYHLAAAGGYGPAQYRLAQELAKTKEVDQTVGAKIARSQLIKRLLQSATANGEAEAFLPLAFFNAIDPSKEKQTEAFRIASAAAQEGNTDAAILLGMLYDRGIAVTKNQNEALYWYRKAIQHPVSAFMLGSYGAMGVDDSEDKTQAIQLLQKSSDAGFSYAALNLGILNYQSKAQFLPQLEQAYSLGNTEAGLLMADYLVSQSSDDSKMNQARTVYQILAEKGDKNAQLKYAYLLDEGIGGEKSSPTEVLHWYEASAGQGQPLAQFLLGQFYERAKFGGMPNYTEAKKWYTAASQTYSPAAIALGFVYETVDEDYPKAKIAYQKAAQMRDPNGSYNLGLMYFQGKGSILDPNKAMQLYISAAEQGQVVAMTELAHLYLEGTGMTRQPKAALHWFKQAEKLGSSDALYQLGLLYETGVGVKIDYPKAKQYYEKAAQKDYDPAILALARMYQYGLGIERDEAQAVHLYEMLAQKNNAYAQYQLAEVLLNQKPEEKMAMVWLSKASNNGYLPAIERLHHLKATREPSLSYIPHLPENRQKTALALNQQDVDWMYFECLNAWNQGDEQASMIMLNQILQVHPNYAPAKKVFEQINQA